MYLQAIWSQSLPSFISCHLHTSNCVQLRHILWALIFLDLQCFHQEWRSSAFSHPLGSFVGPSETPPGRVNFCCNSMSIYIYLDCTVFSVSLMLNNENSKKNNGLRCKVCLPLMLELQASPRPTTIPMIVTHWNIHAHIALGFA